MLTHVLVFLFALTSPDTVEVTIGSGTLSERPETWVQLDSLEKVELGESYWAEVTITGGSSGKCMLQGGNWYMQNIQFFDSEMKSLGVGNYIPIQRTAETSIYYLFYSFHDSKDPNNFSITLTEAEDFLTKKYHKDVFQIGFQTILIFVLLVTTFFILRTSDKVYQHYAYYIGSILIFFSYQYGLWGSNNEILRSISPSWMWIFSASLSYAYGLFARSFLDLKEKDPFNYKWMDYALKYILLVVVIESVALSFSYDILHQVWYKALVIGFQLVFMVVFLYRIAKMNTLISNIFMIGSFVLLAATLTGQVASTFKIAYETNTYVQIGLLLDVFILSIGISVRVNLIQKARQLAQSELIDQLKINERLQSEYTEKLQSQVKERTSDLNKRNLENETLLKEVHHRVKNNLQMISSLLNMQQRRLKTAAEKDALALTKNRVKSIGLIHEHLYKHEDFSKINLRAYTIDLIEILIQSLHKGSEVQTQIDIQELKVNIDVAIPIGLILNELVTNSIKYGFHDVDQPVLSISIQETEDKLVILVGDNGQGIVKKEIKSGFGHTIINTLLESMSGTMETEMTPSGYRTTIKIADYQPKLQHIEN
ncbi:MAG: histidine kinase dimerization/phosphoacceptor domain -containing protein [Cyclobacteriaceae bacterium]